MPADDGIKKRKGDTDGAMNEDSGDLQNAKRGKIGMLSLDQLLASKQKKDTKVAPKVNFVSKKQREKNSERESKKEKDDLKKKQEEFSKRRKEFLLQEEIEREKERQRERDERERERRRREEERQREREEKEKEREALRRSNDEKSLGSSLAELDLLRLPETERRERQMEKELESIKKHYLGVKADKKKMQKPSEKFRNIFNFEWNAEDDTQRGDSNPLYTKKAEPQLLFGRGFRAGIDVREQRKNNSFYEELVSKRAEQAGDDVSNLVQRAMVQGGRGYKDRDLETKDDNKKHWSDKRPDEMTERDWKIFREDFQIFIRGGRVPPPARTWAESPLPWELLEAVAKVGYNRPTAIQMQAIPVAFQHRDLIGVAETGSGKTAALMLPLLNYVKGLPPLDEETAADGPYGIVLAPSRELVLQIEEEAKKFSMFLKCRMISVVGGRNAESQAFALRNGCELVFATPGRLSDSLDKSHTVLNQCNYVVMDEADKMMDMGFEDHVVKCLESIPVSNLKSADEDEALKQELEAKAGHRQFRITQMFTATMPRSVERIAKKYLRCPSMISVGETGEGKKDIEQRLEFISEAQKKKRLEELLQEGEPPIIVFVNQKKAVDVLGKALDNSGFKTCTIHGGKSQEQREFAMNSFKEGKFDVLVATDVAGRGIDVEDVSQVINFDMPKTIEDYTHRIGRTGRAGKKGLATTFVTQEDSEMFYDLKNFLQTTNQVIPHELANHPASKFKPGTIDESGRAKGSKVRDQVIYSSK